MTKEEAIENLKLIRLNAAMTGAESFKEALDLAIVSLSQPSLPSDLDEAAELSANDAMIKRQFPSVVYNTGLKCFDHSDLIKEFKAGAEWMAGKWETIDGEITTTSDNGWEIIRIPKKLYPLGTKVTIQIRKKQ